MAENVVFVMGGLIYAGFLLAQKDRQNVRHWEKKRVNKRYFLSLFKLRPRYCFLPSKAQPEIRKKGKE